MCTQAVVQVVLAMPVVNPENICFFQFFSGAVLLPDARACADFVRLALAWFSPGFVCYTDDRRSGDPEELAPKNFPVAVACNLCVSRCFKP